MKYTVTYQYRADDGMTYSKPTNADSVTVEAESEAAARQAAIDAAYAKHAVCSHVHPTRVVQCD